MGSQCVICGSTKEDVVREDKIRIGRFGTLSSENYRILRCADCLVERLEGAAMDYESEEYRELVDGADGVDEYHRIHDKEQAEKLAIFGSDKIRDGIIADVGCGGGSFLDLIKGMARTTIGIEPNASFGVELENKGHTRFSYTDDALSQYEGKVDAAVSFSVVEHVEDPLGFLQGIRKLLRPKGRFLISTPNRDDILNSLLPEVYPSFFYRQVHRWYFDSSSLERLGKEAGFSSVKVMHHHRFDMSNFVGWLHEQRPTGLGKLPISEDLSQMFVKALETSGKSDYLYAWMEVA